MRILLLTHAFNGLAQRLYVELRRDGHTLSVELDIHDQVSEDAVALFDPDVVIAPFLKRAIPATIWQRRLCLVVHPGPPGDRGPAALDWAILRGVPIWGVSVLQAQDGFDCGPVWAYADFPMRYASKSSLYRRETTAGAVVAVRAAIARLIAGAGPLPVADVRSLAGPLQGWQPALSQAQRAIDWASDGSDDVVRKIRAADGFPGVEHTLLGRVFRMFDANAVLPLPPDAWATQSRRRSAAPGAILGHGGNAQDPAGLCLATRDGAVWIGHLQPMDSAAPAFKQPALAALGPLADGLDCIAAASPEADAAPVDIRYDESGPIGLLSFDFHNGALGSAQCRRLRAAYARARARPTRVIVLMGGSDFWCNGMHLHAIESAASAGAASWENINAIDDLALDILSTDTHLTMAAIGGNAAAGGVFLALATDHVLARNGVVLNPHYRNMGNLFGSEYWTYLLPRRVGAPQAEALMAERLPMGAAEALAMGLIDAVEGPDDASYFDGVFRHAGILADAASFAHELARKRARRAYDEQLRPLSAYREAELERMHRNFFGFDPSYHVARHRFVHRAPAAWTPLHLASHRRAGYARPSPAAPG